jgi:hypothetical protein
MTNQKSIHKVDRLALLLIFSKASSQYFACSLDIQFLIFELTQIIKIYIISY